MFDVFGFYKFTKIKSLKKNKVLLQRFLIKKNIRGTIIIADEGINATISGKTEDIKFTTNKLKRTLKFKDFNSSNISKSSFQPFHKPKVKIKNEVVDTLNLARNKFPGSSLSLDALCKRYRIDNSKRAKHTALVDCDLLSKVYINLLDQKEPTLQFQNINKESSKSSNEKILYFKKIVYPSPVESEEHKKYLKKHLKKNFFN